MSIRMLEHHHRIFTDKASQAGEPIDIARATIRKFPKENVASYGLGDEAVFDAYLSAYVQGIEVIRSGESVEKVSDDSEFRDFMCAVCIQSTQPTSISCVHYRRPKSPAQPHKSYGDRDMEERKLRSLYGR